MRRPLILIAIVSLAITAITSSAEATPTPYANSAYTVKFTMKSAKGKTALLVSRTGRVLALKKITSTNQAVTMVTPKVATITGATLQLVTQSGGDYYGPVVLGWKSKTQIYTQIKVGTSKTLSYGTINLKSVTSKQGYAIAAANSKLVNTSKVVKASNYKPLGVGTYGKARIAGLSAQAVTYAVDQTENFVGADPDGDGLTNQFDVNDDGDTKVDMADSATPTPPQNASGTSCETAASFWIFTNFKSTQLSMQDNINAYGSSTHEATDARIKEQLTNTLSMVIQPVTNVCGENVIKTELKGVGVPYAPADFVDIGTPGMTNDFQWQIGAGMISGNQVAGLPTNRGEGNHGWAFQSTTEISALDTFIQRVTTSSGKTYEFTATAGFIFVTHPLPVRYNVDNTTWNSFTDNATYGDNNHIQLNPTSSVQIEIYRPQRLAIDGEVGTFFDLGGMRYTPDIPNAGAGKCDALSTTDTAMASDTAINTSTKPVLVLTWTVKNCFDARSIAFPTGQWDIDIQVEPAGRGGNSAQKIGFRTNPA